MSARPTSHSRNPADPAARPRGETWVWLTSAGLATGLIMILGLLTLITWRGVTVFWPKRVAQLQLVESSNAGYLGATTIGGEIVQRREPTVHASTEPTPDSATTAEYQLFVGNKDVYGFSFLYVPAAEIASIAYPEDIIAAERMEYGDAIFYPERLELSDGTILDAEEGDFAPRLRALVDAARERREAILDLERRQIGRINRELEDLRLQQRALGDRTDAAAQQARESMAARRNALQERYETLAAEARELRAAQSRDTLHYRVITGQTEAMPVGDLVSFHFVNRLSFFDRVGVAAVNFWNFLSEDPREANTEGGIFPAIFGTFVMTLLMSVAVTPFGVLAAIYLREYAKQGFFVRGVRIAVNNLAGVPSIVFGVFGLGFFVYMVGGTIDQLFFRLSLPSPTFGTGGILWASLTLALMTVPVVIVATEEALSAVSRGIREGSLACGASKWQTIQRLVLPASLPGILTGLILAMARGAGEVAPLMLVGVVKLAPTLPLDATAPFLHLDRKFMHLGFHIYDLGFQSPDSEAAKPVVFATTFLLILLVVVLNLGAIFIRNHLRKKYSSSTF